MNPQKLVLRLLPAHPSSAHFSLSSQTSRDSGEVLLLSSGAGGAWAWTHTAQQALEVAAKGRGPQEQDASVRPQEAPASRKSQEQRVQGGWPH